ncbi:ribonuclease III [Candidatus Legionella polyplacis]|uniref:ribonuclease III n=1 Tax=Candidatus Legionella polyplacis TaxID=2005262 RepID=UPI000C1E8B1C|nr:ribonuclease III [Candidatus Legionella polyplacis]ATW02049.1 ribonuclease III [Candidatus Legionella polyplacis]
MSYFLNINLLEKKLGYNFKNISLLKKALTHCSVGKENNERFEFLGDSILNFIISDLVFQLFPYKNEGEMSKIRSLLVKKEMLFNIASEIKLKLHLNLGIGEIKSGGLHNASILSDALEAIFAAVYIDGGMEEIKKLIFRLYKFRLSKSILLLNLKDAKTELQELLQSKKKPIPQYNLIKKYGKTHKQIFHVMCSINYLNISEIGFGKTIKKAEQDAANRILYRIKKSIF